MKPAIIIAYLFIAVLAVVVFMQWKTIQKLLPATPGTGGNGTANATASGRFADIISATQNALEPKQVTIQY